MAGTISRGVRAPIIRQGDDIVSIVVDSVLETAQKEGFTLHDRDVVAVTEAVVARADGNYCTTDHIAQDVQRKQMANRLRLRMGKTTPTVSPSLRCTSWAIWSVVQ